MAIRAQLAARQRRRPEAGALYQVLQGHLSTFLARADSDGHGLPSFVQRELGDYLRCGQLAAGFARVYCLGCREEELVAFSCKGRGFCPSCGGRRMADTAAHLVDRVFPDVPIRQWVLSLPFELRFLLAREPELLAAVRRIFVRGVFALLRRQARALGIDAPRPGAVVAVQRFDSAVRLNPHLHGLFPDGVFTTAAHQPRATFHALPAPSDAQIARLTEKIARQVHRLLAAEGKLRDDGDGILLDGEASVLVACQAAAVQGRIALGEEAGCVVPRLGRQPGFQARFEPGTLCARLRGFSLHAATAVRAGSRERLESLCRYVLRPALDEQRLAWTGNGKVVYRFKRPWKDGSTHVVFDPLVLVERLAALVPRPHKNLTTYHGVFAPNASYRDRVVPLPKEEAEDAPAFRSCQRRRKRRPVDGVPHRPGHLRRRRYTWAQLMLRCFGVEVLVCPACGGKRRLLTFLSDPLTIERVLAHLGLPTELPALAPARGPPGLEMALEL